MEKDSQLRPIHTKNNNYKDHYNDNKASTPVYSKHMLRFCRLSLYHAFFSMMAFDFFRFQSFVSWKKNSDCCAIRIKLEVVIAVV